jgi:hypothetical protein
MSDSSNTLAESIASDEESAPTSRTPRERRGGHEIARYIALAVMSVSIGLLSTIALVALGYSMIVLVAGTVLGWLVLRTQSTALETVGAGLYAIAVVTLLIPIGQYAPRIFYIEGVTAAPGGWTALGGIVGLVTTSIIALIVALILSGIGYLLRRRAR